MAKNLRSPPRVMTGVTTRSFMTLDIYATQHTYCKRKTLVQKPGGLNYSFRLKKRLSSFFSICYYSISYINISLCSIATQLISELQAYTLMAADITTRRRLSSALVEYLQDVISMLAWRRRRPYVDISMYLTSAITLCGVMP